MRMNTIASTRWLFPKASRARQVRIDAEALIRAHGNHAIEAAERNSVQEDLGLLPTISPGHWSRVVQEIARRSGQAGTAARENVAA